MSAAAADALPPAGTRDAWGLGVSAADRPLPASADPVDPVSPPNDRTFGLFQELLRGESGICLNPGRKDMLVARLRRRVLELGLCSFESYYRRVQADAAERAYVLDRLSTHETRFFREPQQLAFLSERLLPSLRASASRGERPRRVRAWSAGCATGEEAYTLAMILRDQLPEREGWQLEVVATDLSPRVLQEAERGRYPVARAAEIPAPALRAHMLKGVRSLEGWMDVAPAVRALVRFGRLNLVSDVYPAGPFELVLCRNVIIYFDVNTRRRVVQRLAERLAGDGFLLLGHSESLNGTLAGLHHVGPLSYGRRPGALE